MVTSLKSRLLQLTATSLALLGAAGCVPVAGQNAQATQPTVVQTKERTRMVVPHPSGQTVGGAPIISNY